MNPILAAAIRPIAGLVSSTLATAAEPALLGAQYGARATLAKVVIPGPGELMHAMTYGRLTRTAMIDALAFHGIDGTNARWEAVRESTWTPPTIDAILTTARRDHWSEAMISERLRLHGIWDNTPLWTNAPWPWTPEQVRILYALGALRNNAAEPQADVDARYKAWLAAAGLVRDWDTASFEALVQPLTYHEAIVARNRQIITDAEMREYLALEGFTRQREIDVLGKLRAEIPTVSELIGFSVKNVFSKEISEAFGYDDEFKDIPSYQVWMARNGYIGNPTISREDAQKLVDEGSITAESLDEFLAAQDPSLKSWAQAHWRDHWINPSPTQGYAALHRLRPTDTTKPGPRVPNVPGAVDQDGRPVPVSPFTMTDLQLLLRANDYVPKWRPTLAALSYNVLRLVDIRRIVELSIRDPEFQDRTIGPSRTINRGAAPGPVLPNPTPEQRLSFLRAWTVENFLDRGQTPEAATALAELSISGARRVIDAPHRARERRAVTRLEKLNERAYATYAIGQATFVSGSMSSWKTFAVGAVSTSPYPGGTGAVRQVSVGFDVALAKLIDAERKQHEYEVSVRSVRQDFLDGSIDIDDATAFLKQIGMIEGAIEGVLGQWASRMNLRHSVVKTANVLRWYKLGLITENEALARLENLGWSAGDALLEIESQEFSETYRGYHGSRNRTPNDSSSQP